MNPLVRLHDGELVRRALAGEVERFGELVERYRVEFGRLAEGLVGDADAAEDALQEACIAAYRNLGGCRDPERFRVWFYRIVANCCYDARRRRRTAVSLDEVDLPARDRAEERVEEAEFVERLWLALDTLPTDQLEAFVMKELQEMSYEEMARLLDTRIETLRMRVHRARDLLRQRLGDDR